MKTRNARFWIYFKSSWVKLTLTPDQTIRFGEACRTDEGSRRTGETYTHAGERVHASVWTWERDCDGVAEFYWQGSCALDRLADNCDDADLPPRPLWSEGVTECRDEYAEAAGY